MATIITDVPIEIDLDEIKSKENYDSKALKELLLKLNMKTVIEKLCQEEIHEEKNIEVINVTSIEDMREVFSKEKDISYISYSVTNKEVYSKINIDEIYICKSDEEIVIIKYNDIFKYNQDEILKIIKNFAEDESIKKVIHDAKDLITILGKYDIELKNLLFDTKIAGYIIDSSTGKYELNDLIEKYLSVNANISKEELVSYIKSLYNVLEEKIKQDNMEKLLYEVELPLVYVLSSMESEGFKIDKDVLEEIAIKLKSEIEKTQEEIYSLSEEEFNISSPKQLGKILFEKLDLPVIKKTKTGYSTNAEVLEKLEDKHPIIPKIIYYRQLTKLNSTYIEGLRNVIDVDGYVHSSFNQTVTTTGRLSSTEPNLQNIPIKYEMGREIRKMFIPKEKGDMILSCDYSQIELRVLAHMTKDENMIDAFNNHSDIHRKTASEVFNVPFEDVTKLMRSRAKAVNFGIIYGISDWGLSEQISSSPSEAKKIITTFYEKYTEIKEYFTNVINFASKYGYITTLYKRRRYISELKSSNYMTREFGKRAAMNAPIQGSAADLIKIAMIKVDEMLSSSSYKTQMVLQIHDELIFKVPKDEKEVILPKIKDIMENATTLDVKLKVDGDFGRTWFDCK